MNTEELKEALENTKPMIFQPPEEINYTVQLDRIAKALEKIAAQLAHMDTVI